MAVVNMVVGATSPSTGTVIAKVDGGGPVRIAYQGGDPAVSSPTFTVPVAVDAQGVASVLVEELTENTKYFYQVEDDGNLDVTITGSFTTHPPVDQPADITFAVGGCAGSTPAFPGLGAVAAPERLSNSPVFGHILEADPLWISQIGDLAYYDLGQPEVVGSGTLDDYRLLYDDVLLQPEQLALFSQVAWQGVWDNHDFGRTGPNTSNKDLPNKANAQQVFRERVPSYPLSDPEGIWQQWRVGRVQFVALDSRSYRDSNLDQDGPSKTMLGVEQKAWLAGLLAVTPAVFLVVLSPSAWFNPASGDDTWESFQTERTELINLFTETGFINRMCMIWGDRHAMGMDSGTFTPGGMPGMQFTAMDDGTPPAPQNWFDTGPESSQNGQWGTVRLNDLGDTLEMTATGWVMGDPWRVMNVTFALTDEPPPPPPPPGGELVQVASPTIRNQVTWLACDLVSGKVITELPDLRGPVSRVIAEHTTSQLDLPISTVGGRTTIDGKEMSLAQRAKLARYLVMPETPRVMLVAVVNDIPMWGGIPLRPQGGTASAIRLSVPSLEAYMLHRFVRDHSWTDQDISSVIAAGLLADAEAPINGIGGGIGLVVDAPATGITATRNYLADDHASVYERLSELVDIQNGIEWTIDLDWADNRQNTIVKIARVRLRIGDAATRPPAVFQIAADSVFQAVGSSDTTYEHERDWGEGRFANAIQAYSTGEGEDQPTSDFALDTTRLEAGAPIFEEHYQPSTSIKSEAVLNDHAEARLARIRLGTRVWRISARWDAHPRYGVHWNLGDDVGFDLVGHLHPGRKDGGAGVSGTSRAVGFELDVHAGRIGPILLDPEGQENV